MLRRAWRWTLARLFRQVGDTHRHFGNQYGNRDEHWAAIENYTRAVELDPGYAQAYYSRGVIYWREIGNHYRAIQDLTRVIELDPSCAQAHFNRAIAHQLRHDLDLAIADLEHYLSVGQDEYWLASARRQLVELRAANTSDAHIEH
ncbi:MAG: tetratricopeptide repeat protein [Anaerolineae bacterium]|jgi:tetratricopeptide (TPR) repeat protein